MRERLLLKACSILQKRRKQFVFITLLLARARNFWYWISLNIKRIGWKTVMWYYNPHSQWLLNGCWFDVRIMMMTKNKLREKKLRSFQLSSNMNKLNIFWFYKWRDIKFRYNATSSKLKTVRHIRTKIGFNFHCKIIWTTSWLVLRKSIAYNYGVSTLYISAYNTYNNGN